MAELNDIVLIYLEDVPVSFARVESILPDHKKDWFQIKLLMLQIPLQVVVWILKAEYINGAEFHMNQKRMRLEKVVCPVEELPDPKPRNRDPEESGSPKENGKTSKDASSNAQVISFSDFRKKQE